MIRVKYQWRVKDRDFEDFTNIWRETTNNIHNSIEGALGTFMMRSIDNPEIVVTIAKWQSYDVWQQFWGNQNPEAMLAMRQLGERMSVEAFEEIEDHTR